MNETRKSAGKVGLAKAGLGVEPREMLETLRQQMRRIETAQRPADESRVSSGCVALDRLLPGGGFGRGTLVEWLSDGIGHGAGTLALVAARQAVGGGANAGQSDADRAFCSARGAIVIVDDRETFYPPAAVQLGIDLEQVIVLRAAGLRERQWAWDQALRCPGVAVVWGHVERLDDRWFRRWQLAVEAGGGIGFLLRSTRMRGRPSWADVQLVAQPLPSQGDRRWRIEVTRARGGPAGGAVELEMDEVTATLREASRSDEPRSLSLAAELARATSGRRSARA